MPDELHDPQLGISIRFIRAWNPSLANEITPADCEFIRRQLWTPAMRQRVEVGELERMFMLPSPPERR